MQTFSDDILWDSFRQGNKNALAALFERFYPQLYNYAKKISANHSLIEDAIQDLFIEIWNQRSPGILVSVQAYLLKALRYKLIRMLNNRHDMSDILTEVPFEISHENFLINKEEELAYLKLLCSEMEKLPPRQREIIFLRFYQSLSYEEICAVMGIEYQVARNQLSAGIKKLRSLLKTPTY